jgi:hypothetical protein
MIFECNKWVSPKLNQARHCILKRHKCYIKTEALEKRCQSMAESPTIYLYVLERSLALSWAHLQISIDSLLGVLLEVLGTGCRIVSGGLSGRRSGIACIHSGGFCLNIGILGGGRILVGVILGSRRSLVSVVPGSTSHLIGHKSAESM